MRSVCFVVEHLEPGLPSWALLEYTHLVHHILNIHTGNVHIVFTNVSSQIDKFSEMLKGIAAEYHQNEQVLTSQPPSLNFSHGQKLVSVVSLSALSYIENQCKFKKKTESEQNPIVILLDPFAEEKLMPLSTAKSFGESSMTYLVFGGILGDHPMNGRTYEELSKDFLRKDNNQVFHLIYRNLGKLQMTTDTAVLVSAAVCLKDTPLDSLHYIDEPKIVLSSAERVKMKGFRYLSSVHAHDGRYTSVVSSAMFPKGLTELLKTDYSVE